MGTSQSVDEAPRDPNADLVERRATMRRLNPPQEVEVRTVSAVGEVSVGLIECSTAESLESLRAKIQSQLDGVPAQFVFLLWNRGRAPIGRRQEAQRAVLDVLLDGVVRIGAPGSQILPNSAREDASEALAAEPPKPAPLPRFVQASREISDKASATLGLKVCVINTGGTIGMKPTPDGYRPAPGFLFQYLRSSVQFQDPAFSVDEDILTSPLSRLGKHVRYSVMDLEPLMDSSNMTSEHWIKIAKQIAALYTRFDSFVILHGTDTMAYTAAALSFMLEGLGKTVILTGSMVPLSQPMSDGADNFLGALLFAGHYEIPEVMIYFNHELLRGNRCTKTHSEAYNAFSSPNFRPLAEVGTMIHIRWNNILNGPPPKARLQLRDRVSSEVVVIHLFPSIPKALLRNMLSPPVRGAVLRTYGSGNAPDDPEFLGVLAEACARGVVVVNITQCSVGSVSSQYATGSSLLRAGVMSGVDMTVEAALAKMCVLLGDPSMGPAEVRNVMQSSMRGELTPPVRQERFSLKDSHFVKSVAAALGAVQEEEKEFIVRALGPILLCSSAEAGNLKEVERLVEEGINPRQTDYDMRTPLHVAAAAGEAKVVEYLIKSGARMNARDRFDNTPLDNALLHGQDEVIDVLLKNGARLGLQNLGTRLCTAAANGDLGFIQRVAKCGGDLGRTDYDHRTALHLACSEGKTEVVRFLIANGAELNARDRWGRSPLDDARANQRADCETLLLDAISKRDAKPTPTSTAV